MGGVLDCSADPFEGEIDLSTMEGPIVKPFHAMSIKELAYNVEYEKKEDALRCGGGGSNQKDVAVRELGKEEGGEQGDSIAEVILGSTSA